MTFFKRKNQRNVKKIKRNKYLMILCIILARYSHIQWLIKTKKQIKIKRQLIMTIYGRKIERIKRTCNTIRDPSSAA